jgi:hypothetical protein
VSTTVVVGGSLVVTTPLHHARAAASVRASYAMTTGRTRHAARMPDGQALITGGQNASGVLSSVEIFDATTGTSTAALSMATARADHTATSTRNVRGARG